MAAFPASRELLPGFTFVCIQPRGWASWLPTAGVKQQDDFWQAAPALGALTQLHGDHPWPHEAHTGAQFSIATRNVLVFCPLLWGPPLYQPPAKVTISSTSLPCCFSKCFGKISPRFIFFLFLPNLEAVFKGGGRVGNPGILV